MKAIDLFAGVGGFSVGFERLGFEIIKAVEFDPEIAETYKHNHPRTQVIVEDIKNVDDGSFFIENEADIIIGGPPCQGFSMAGARIRNGFINDPRNFLFRHYLNIVKKVLPKIFIIENVKGIITMQKGEIFKEIIDTFSESSNFNGVKYNVYHFLVKASDYGIPQARERVIIFGLRDIEVDLQEIHNTTKSNILKIFPTFFEDVTVWDAISNLSDIETNDVVLNPSPVTKYQQYLYYDNKYLNNHVGTKHSKIAEERMARIKSGGNFTSLDESIKSIHSGSYGRLEKDKLSPTITTRFDTPSGGRFIHPIHNRTLTLREAARIQSFHDSFVFKGSKSSICKQIGNAVPPKLSFYIASMVKEMIGNEN